MEIGFLRGIKRIKTFLTTFLTVAIIVFIIGFVGYCVVRIDKKYSDEEKFYEVWRSEYLITRKPGEYSNFDLNKFIDKKMIEMGYVKFEHSFYKNGVRVDYDQLPTPFQYHSK